jgi:DNA-binding response OmpR family regulator
MGKKWVLLVDDDVELAALLGIRLTEAGYGVVVAHSLREAQLKMRNQMFNCVVCDIQLGDGSGADLVDQMRDPRRKDKNIQSPVLMISSGINQEVAIRLKGKVQGAMVKPFHPDELAAKVKQLDSSAEALLAKPLNS